jgi:CheY-like chemotaxis protein
MKPSEVPQAFAQQVRTALTHLFDPASLQYHPLLDALVPQDVGDRQARAQALRELILRAIGDLKPPTGTSPNDPEYRPYAILRQRYANGFSRQEVERNLAISRRQFFREQQRALAAITGLLWERRLGEPAGNNELGLGLDEEWERLGQSKHAFSLEASARRAIAVVRSLTDRRGIGLALYTSGEPQVFGDESVTRQLIVTVLSLLAQRYASGNLVLELRQERPWASLVISGLRADVDQEQLEGELAMPRRLAARVGGTVEQRGEGSKTCLRLLLPVPRESVIAIVDDNPKTLRLFQRYLSPYSYRPVLIQESVGAAAAICELQPDAVLLDIMMQDVDGWQVLQTLKSDPRTRAIPVIVCSVLNEDELARSIGADLYLRKPISPVTLVQALARLGLGSEPASPSGGQIANELPHQPRIV